MCIDVCDDFITMKTLNEMDVNKRYCLNDLLE